LARQGFRVLLTCFNVNLAEFLRGDETLSRGLEVTNFHKLASDLAHKAGLTHPGPRDDRYFDEVLPELMMQAADRLGSQYDAIIVDEGQDFYDNWWGALQCLLHDPDQGIFYVFFDDNQNLYQAMQYVPLELAPFPLTRNCRNTQRIHRMVMHFYQSDQMPQAQGPLGRPVEVRTYDYLNGLKHALHQVLHRLVVEESVPSEDIVILTPRGREHSRLWRLGTVGDFCLADQWTTASGEIFCTTVHAFKGLESPVVILAEVEPYGIQEIERVLYVGCSRACHHLIVLASARLSEDVKQRLVSS
jgi:superfamily I DNA/RNA helicase